MRKEWFSRITKNSLEFKGILSNNFDIAGMNKNETKIHNLKELDILWSVGGGIMFITKSGEIEVVVGFPMDAMVGESMLHVRYSHKF